MRSYMKERKENRLFYLLNHTEEIVIVAMFAVMVAVIFVQVIMRKCGNSLTWSEELGKFLFVWITWLGISLGERKGEHIKITMLTDRLPFRVAQVVNILSEIIVIIICAVTFYYGITLVFSWGYLDARIMRSHLGTHYAGIKISVSWGYLAVVVGCGLMILRSVWGFGRSLKYLFKGAPAEQDGEEKGGAEQ